MSTQNEVRDFLLGLKKESKIYFTGTTTRNPIEYKTGEPIVFKIRVEADGEYVEVPYIYYTTEGDDGEKSDGYLEPCADGYFYIETSLKRDGFVRVIAKACDENKNEIAEVDPFQGGAGADVDKIKCETDIPDDYLDFWKSLKEAAFAVPEQVLFQEEIAAPEGFVAFSARYATPTGKYISVVYSYPKDAKEKSLKVRFSNMGYGVDDCVPFFKKGYLIVRANTHDILNGQSPEYYKEKQKELDGYGLRDRKANEKPETSFWYKLYFRDFQVIKYFMNHPLANRIDYVFEGGSQAAFQSVNLAAHSGIATQARLHIPWFCDIFAIQKQKRITIDWRPLEDDGLRYFDTAVGGQFLKCPVYIEAGLGDYTCPPSGQLALYNGIKAPKKLRFVQNRTHAYLSPVIITNEISDGYDQAEFFFNLGLLL